MLSKKIKDRMDKNRSRRRLPMWKWRVIQSLSRILKEGRHLNTLVEEPELYRLDLPEHDFKLLMRSREAKFLIRRLYHSSTGKNNFFVGGMAEFRPVFCSNERKRNGHVLHPQDGSSES